MNGFYLDFVYLFIYFAFFFFGFAAHHLADNDPVSPLSCFCHVFSLPLFLPPYSFPFGRIFFFFSLSFCQVVRQKIQPNNYIFSSFILGLVAAGQADAALEAFRHTIALNLSPTHPAKAELVKCLSQAGRLADMQEVLAARFQRRDRQRLDGIVGGSTVEEEQDSERQPSPSPAARETKTMIMKNESAKELSKVLVGSVLMPSPMMDRSGGRIGGREGVVRQEEELEEEKEGELGAANSEVKVVGS